MRYGQCVYLAPHSMHRLPSSHQHMHGHHCETTQLDCMLARCMSLTHAVPRRITPHPDKAMIPLSIGEINPYPNHHLHDVHVAYLAMCTCVHAARRTQSCSATSERVPACHMKNALQRGDRRPCASTHASLPLRASPGHRLLTHRVCGWLCQSVVSQGIRQRLETLGPRQQQSRHWSMQYEREHPTATRNQSVLTLRETPSLVGTLHQAQS
jgi:hypothetical protein